LPDTNFHSTLRSEVDSPLVDHRSASPESGRPTPLEKQRFERRPLLLRIGVAHVKILINFISFAAVLLLVGTLRVLFDYDFRRLPLPGAIIRIVETLITPPYEGATPQQQESASAFSRPLDASQEGKNQRTFSSCDLEESVSIRSVTSSAFVSPLVEDMHLRPKPILGSARKTASIVLPTSGEATESHRIDEQKNDCASRFGKMTMKIISSEHNLDELEDFLIEQEESQL
jgi:hypothetical protein